MDSVYDAALAHAEKLKAELETLQNFLDLHDHFRARFGLTPSQATAPDAPSKAQAPVADPAAATHEIHVQALDAEAEDAAEAPTPALYASTASKPEAVETEEPVEAATDAPLTEASEADSADEPRVIKASEGVLIAAAPELAAPKLAAHEPEAVPPLGPEATLQSVAEKLAATISASHPTVTGYTV